MKCLNECKKVKQACKQKDCRMWVDYQSDYNCTLESVNCNGSMSLREVASRLGISFVRVKQIEDVALEKFLNKLTNTTKLSKDYLKEILFSE
mgnify:FL=1